MPQLNLSKGTQNYRILKSEHKTFKKKTAFSAMTAAAAAAEAAENRHEVPSDAGAKEENENTEVEKKFIRPSSSVEQSGDESDNDTPGSCFYIDLLAISPYTLPHLGIIHTSTHTYTRIHTCTHVYTI